MDACKNPIQWPLEKTYDRFTVLTRFNFYKAGRCDIKKLVVICPYAFGREPWQYLDKSWPYTCQHMMKSHVTFTPTIPSHAERTLEKQRLQQKPLPRTHSGFILEPTKNQQNTCVLASLPAPEADRQRHVYLRHISA